MTFTDTTAQENALRQEGVLGYELVLTDESGRINITALRNTHKAMPGAAMVSIVERKAQSPIPYWWTTETLDQAVQLVRFLERKLAKVTVDAEGSFKIPPKLAAHSRNPQPLALEFFA